MFQAGNVNYCVPLVSILGSKLFLIYMNNFPLSFKESSSHLNANDTCIFTFFSTVIVMFLFWFWSIFLVQKRRSLLYLFFVEVYPIQFVIYYHIYWVKAETYHQYTMAQLCSNIQKTPVVMQDSTLSETGRPSNFLGWVIVRDSSLKVETGKHLKYSKVWFL